MDYFLGLRMKLYERRTMKPVSLQKISGISAKHSSKLDALHSICSIFVEDKRHLSKTFKQA